MSADGRFQPVDVGKPGLQQLQPGGDWLQVQL
jgi:hypothetical protein